MKYIRTFASTPAEAGYCAVNELGHCRREKDFYPDNADEQHSGQFSTGLPL